MTSQNIEKSILEIYRKHNIKSFPFDCFELLKNCNIKCISYPELPVRKREACMKLSEDACFIMDTVYYNPDKPPGRIRFSVMHELGHIILNTHEEPLANTFASCILAPRMAIHYARCKNQADVASTFSLTYEAGEYAFNSYKRWHRYKTYHKMTPLDKEYYDHFYNQEAAAFVFHTTKCPRCQARQAYNHAPSCPQCINIHPYSYPEEPEDTFKIAEHNWLYSSDY